MEVNSLLLAMPQGNRFSLKPVQEDSPQAFNDILMTSLKEVNRLQVQADVSTEKMVLGEINDIHQVMLDTEKAKLSLQLAVQVRNKLVEAYQEVSRMQF